MENFSTPRMAVLPRATNLATLAVVVAATWWSGAQRPAGPVPMAQASIAASQSAALPVQQTTSLAPSETTATTTPPAQSHVFWPAQAAANIARDGLQAVGFKTTGQR